jgi:hypothetical protein
MGPCAVIFSPTHMMARRQYLSAFRSIVQCTWSGKSSALTNCQSVTLAPHGQAMLTLPRILYRECTKHGAVHRPQATDVVSLLFVAAAFVFIG